MYYFAYGSNLSRKQMAERVPCAKPKFAAILPNYTVVFTGYSRQWRGGTATLRYTQGAKAKGAVYEITPKELAALDKHEGYPETYDHLAVKVVTPDDEFVDAVTYISKRSQEETKPSEDYLVVIRQGYKDWRIR